MGQSITGGYMLLHGLSQRNPPMETLRQQAGGKQPEGSDLQTRGGNWWVGGGGTGGKTDDHSRRECVFVCVCSVSLVYLSMISSTVCSACQESNIKWYRLRFEYNRLIIHYVSLALFGALSIICSHWCQSTRGLSLSITDYWIKVLINEWKPWEPPLQRTEMK